MKMFSDIADEDDPYVAGMEGKPRRLWLCVGIYGAGLPFGDQSRWLSDALKKLLPLFFITAYAHAHPNILNTHHYRTHGNRH